MTKAYDFAIGLAEKDKRIADLERQLAAADQRVAVFARQLKQAKDVLERIVQDARGVYPRSGPAVPGRDVCRPIWPIRVSNYREAQKIVAERAGEKA